MDWHSPLPYAVARKVPADPGKEIPPGNGPGDRRCRVCNKRYHARTDYCCRDLCPSCYYLIYADDDD